MKHNLFSILIFILVICSCKSEHKAKEAVVNNTSIDTILTLDSLNFLQSRNPGTLTRELAHKTLLEYFAKKNYYPEEKISLDSLLSLPVDEENFPMCIEFDTLYTMHLNKDKVLDGIVTYWQVPCAASGTCWQPHRAMITSINNKYIIINTDFIPERYLIDSITQDSNQIFINGKIYDCSNHEYIKPYKASIKRLL